MPGRLIDSECSVSSRRYTCQPRRNWLRVHSPSQPPSVGPNSNVNITLDRYGHLMPGNEAEAAELLDTYLERKAG